MSYLVWKTVLYAGLGSVAVYHQGRSGRV